jgi:hypothetical protein
VRQQVAQPARRAERNGEQPARTERRHALVELVARRFDRIAESLLTGMAIPAGHSAGRPTRGYRAIRAIGELILERATD